MANEISFTRGEFMAMTITLQDDGENVYADTANGYAIEAQMSNINGGSEIYDLGATFSNGNGIINYDTENVTAGIYYFDIKLGFPSGEEKWTESFVLTLAEPNTKP